MAEAIFHYLIFNGRGEASRMIMHYNGFAFQDKKYTKEEFAKIKDSGDFEFEKIPVLEIDGKKLCESYAIESFLCRRFGYTSSDPYELYSIESIVSLKNDFAMQPVRFIFPVYDPEGLHNWLRENLGKWLSFFEKRLVANNDGEGFFVGNAPTHADFVVFQYFYDYYYTKSDSWGRYEALFDENAPKLKAFLTRFPETSTTLKAYIDQKDKNLPI